MPATAASQTATRPQLWLAALQQGSVWKRAATLGLSVGMVQALINQGDYWVHNTFNAIIIVKTVVSPLITFSVALASAASTWVDKHFPAN